MAARVFESPKIQLQQLQLGVVDFISESEILAKLEYSFKEKKPLRIKFGADPTRADLHLGHTVVLNKLRQFQDLGHEVDFIVGDFTALIGDPSGRNETRPPLSPEEIAINAKTYAEQVFKVLDESKAKIIFNSAWLNDLKPSQIIKLAAQYTVARMLEREDFTQRFQKHIPISIHEFLYPLCQGFDSVHLRSDIELGGTDQKFNLLVGRELQKSYGQKHQQCVITLPLLEGLDGVQKMSKSYDNYISVVETPKDMFGKTLRVSDTLMFRWYELLTNIGPVQLQKLKADVASGSLHPKKVKIDLAKFLVTRFYSSTEAEKAEDEFERIFVQKGLPDEVPEVFLKPQEIFLTQLLSQLQLVASNGEAKRLIQQKAVEIDQVKVSDEKIKLNLVQSQSFILKVGKKKFIKVKVE